MRSRNGPRWRAPPISSRNDPAPLNQQAKPRRRRVPWMTANDISIHYELGGDGPSVVLMHEMGGTLDSWDAIAPALAKKFRVMRYDQRGSGLTEKVRQPYGNDTLVDDLQALLGGLKLPPPYHI